MLYGTRARARRLKPSQRRGPVALFWARMTCFPMQSRAKPTSRAASHGEHEVDTKHHQKVQNRSTLPLLCARSPWIPLTSNTWLYMSDMYMHWREQYTGIIMALIRTRKPGTQAPTQDAPTTQ